MTDNNHASALDEKLLGSDSSSVQKPPTVLTTYDGPVDVEDSEETKRHILHLVLPATFFIGLGLGNSIAFSAIVLPMMLRNPSWNRDVSERRRRRRRRE